METRSEAELSDVGSYNYSLHPSTRALLVSITNEDGNVCDYDLTINDHWPKEWEIAVKEGWEIHSWGNPFEHAIVTNVLKHWPQPHQEMWRDTMSKALCCGFPAKLGACAKALRLADQKDEAGAALINYFSKPIATGGRAGLFRTKADSPEKWEQFVDYCHQDVVTEIAIDKALPDLTDDELAFHLATWDMNLRGIHIDVALVKSLIAMVADGRLKIKDALDGLFEYEDLSNHRKVLDYVQSTGVDIQSVAKARVMEALAMDIPESARSVLEARKASGKTSVAKLDAILAQVGPDGRLRHMTRAHGTSTGRDASVGLNIQNLPRGEKMDVTALIAAAQAGDQGAFAAAAVVKGRPDPLGGVVTCLRGCFSAAPGTIFHQCDWSAVEPRIGAWLVGDTAMLEAFRKIDTEGGLDIYQMEAARFYGCTPQEVIGDKRQFGKVYTLACQYQAGEATVQRFAKDMYGIILDLDEARRCKDHWRSTHPLWVNHWHDINTAALSAIRCQGRVFSCGKTAFCFNGQHLKMRLPSGRIVWFPWARIDPVETDYGAKDALTYEYVHSLSKQWVRGPQYGGSLANLVTQGTGADLLRYAARNLRRRGINVVLRVHDEAVVEIGVDRPELSSIFKATMLESPPWAPDLKLNGAGWVGPRYKKD